MLTLIIVATLLVALTVVVSLATAADLGKQRSSLAGLDQRLLNLEDELEKVSARRKVAAGTLDLHRRQLDENRQYADELAQELKDLEEERVADREIKVASGLRQKSIEDAFGEE